MDGECPICYEPFEANKPLRLKCGHCMHGECAKNWYIKANTDNPTCPMCRGPFVFKGCFTTLPRWDDEMYGESSPILEEFLEAVFEHMETSCNKKFWLKYLSKTLVLFHVMSVLECSDEEIECALWNDEWISPKWATRWEYWDDWPLHLNEKPTKYPWLELGRNHHAT